MTSQAGFAELWLEPGSEVGLGGEPGLGVGCGCEPGLKPSKEPIYPVLAFWFWLIGLICWNKEK